ncbi:MAG: DUF3365 domain-containing protein [Alphaproteobacteria bacterium]
MGLRTKFNLVLVVAFAIGLGLAALLSFRIIERNATEEVIQNANVMIEAASAVRTYTSTEIAPLLNFEVEVQEAEAAAANDPDFRLFLPHTVPAFAAKANLGLMLGKFEDYSYREAALAPTNPSDLATPFEADIIGQFGADPQLTEIVRQHEEDGEQYMVLARPIRVSSESCLVCHSVPARAPQAMLDLYGEENGFGWQIDQVVAAQIVTVPMSVPLDRADTVFRFFMITLAGVFVLVLIILNVILQYVVIKPVLRMSDIAGRVSMGESDVPEYVRPGKDEIASLSVSFNRMRRSLENAMKLLDE